MTKKLNELTIVEAARALRAHECTVQELFDACRNEALARNGELNAYLEIFDADTDAIASAQKRIDTEGDDAPLLCGIPVAMKDNILIKGHIASAASKILENYTATYDSTVTKKLKEAGALFVGRANMDEFGMGASTENSAYGPSKNPYDLARSPGGSSGGSAVAVAANLALGAFGSDTGGSCRQPAAYCGIVGFKPTYGAISRNGLISLGSSLDQVGEMGKSVDDVQALFEAVRGQDALDSTTFSDDAYSIAPTDKKYRIGVPEHLLTGVDDRVAKNFKETIEALRTLGHTIVPIELKASEYALAMYYIVLPAEISANLARFDGVRYGLHKETDDLLHDYLASRTEGFGPESVRRILVGTFVLSSGYIDAFYYKANAGRALLRKEYEEAFTQVDIIANPTTPSVPFKFGEKSDPVSMYLEDIFTVSANLTGLPALSVPMGTVLEEGVTLPTGLLFTAPSKKEGALFDMGRAVEKIHNV